MRLNEGTELCEGYWVHIDGDYVGLIEPNDAGGVDAFSADRVLIGQFRDRETADDALTDRWWGKKSKAAGDGGTPRAIAGEEPSLQPGLARSEEQPQSLAVTFLEKLRPGGPWVSTAIVPDGAPTTITARTPDEVEAFIREHDGKRGLYYSVNPTRTALSKKAAKTDIAAIEYILGDLDPADGETSEAAKARYLEQLNGTFEPKATAGVDSGNGIQGLWKLKERIALGEPINGKFSPEDQAKIDDVEARAANVMRRLGSKAGTQNIDRILRLPGTTNLPNAKKRKEGRVACQAKLLWFDDVSYPLDVFPLDKSRDDAPNPFGVFPEEPPHDESGSGHGFRFMRDCHAKGMDYQEARAGILASKSKAGEWARRVDERQLDRAWENSKEEAVGGEVDALVGGALVGGDAANPVAALMQLRNEGADLGNLLVALNRNFAVVKRGSKVRVAYITGKDVDFMLFDDFHNMLGNLVTKKKKTVVSKRWLKWEYRRQYVGRGVVFEPGGPLEIPGDKLNLWRGFGIEPKQGDWSPMRNHIRNVACRENEEHFQYTIKWMAYGVQYLDRPVGTMPAFRGEEGAGKGIIWRNYGRLFGKHFKHITHGEHLTGRFNATLGDACFVFLDEALWAGDRKGEQILKALITEDTFQLELKHFDTITVKNRLRTAAAGNSQWIVPVSPRGRRNFVLDTSNRYANENDPAHAVYWGPLQEQFGDYAPDDGRAAMLYDLLHMDLTGFNILAVPKSAAKTEQKLLTQAGTAAWLFEILQEGAIQATSKKRYGLDIFQQWNAKGMEIVRDDAYQAYLQFSQEQREYRPRSKEWWSRDLRKILKDCISDHRPQGKNADHRRHLIFGPLEKCRKVYGEFLEADDIGWDQA